MEEDKLSKLKHIWDNYPPWILYIAGILSLFGIYYQYYIYEPVYTVECRFMNSTTEIIYLNENMTEVCDYNILWDNHKPKLYKHLDTQLIMENVNGS